jgi:predicted metal-dependent enzyme (double-stranded beta helix superfamily)
VAVQPRRARLADRSKQPADARENAMAYSLDQFIADCRATLARDPGPSGRETVRKNLEKLLANQDFIKSYCGDDQPRGLKVLYEDDKLGFQVLAHINDKARVSPPHDHGESWAIYGQATKYTEMTEWEHEDDGSDPNHAKLKPIKKYRLEPGMAGIYQDGAIHSIDYPDYARFVRVTGTNLDKIKRMRVDLKTGEVHQMTPQQAT